MGMGLGMGIGVGGTFGNAINYIAKDTMGGLLNPLSPKEEANPLENYISSSSHLLQHKAKSIPFFCKFYTFFYFIRNILFIRNRIQN